MIVSLEGIDASGKETQCKLLLETLKQEAGDDKFDAKVFSFPNYNSVAGGVVGRILRGERLVIDASEETDELTIENKKAQWSEDKAIIIQSVMIADRLEWQSEMLNWYDNLDGEGVLILDRYKMSGVVYGQADGVTRDWMMKAQHTVREPDVSILVDLSVEESVRRRPDRQDYYEKNVHKLRRVRELYLQEFALHAQESNHHYFVVDGVGTVEEVHQRVSDCVRAVELLC